MLLICLISTILVKFSWRCSIHSTIFVNMASSSSECGCLKWIIINIYRKYRHIHREFLIPLYRNFERLKYPKNQSMPHHQICAENFSWLLLLYSNSFPRSVWAQRTSLGVISSVSFNLNSIRYKNRNEMTVIEEKMYIQNFTFPVSANPLIIHSKSTLSAIYFLIDEVQVC